MANWLQMDNPEMVKKVGDEMSVEFAQLLGRRSMTHRDLVNVCIGMARDVMAQAGLTKLRSAVVLEMFAKKLRKQAKYGGK